MISQRLRLGFVHVPHTGGTSIEVAATGYDWWHRAAGVAKHLTWRECQQCYACEMSEGYDWFAIVRDPVNRLKTLYRGEGRTQIASAWHGWLDREGWLWNSLFRTQAEYVAGGGNELRLFDFPRFFSRCPYPLPRFNASSKTATLPVDEGRREFLREIFAEDYEIYDRVCRFGVPAFPDLRPVPLMD